MNVEIVFRQIHEPLPQTWAPGVHWQVEAYPTDFAFGHPIGICWVSDVSIRRPPDWEGDDFPAMVDFILVADEERRQGVATALIEACKNRWPDLNLGDAISEAGEGLLEKVKRTPVD